jgi:hypothetical protein
MVSVCVVPSQKEFDVDAAREGALDPFWRRGHDATSVNDLVAELGHEGSPDRADPRPSPRFCSPSRRAPG